MAHWSERYLGREWREDEFECGDLAALVGREVFGKQVHLPNEHHDTPSGRAAAIAAYKDDFATRTETPSDGDPVLLVSGKHAQHIGVYCVINGEPWILHNQAGTGVLRTRLRHLGMWHYKIEGFYRWT